MAHTIRMANFSKTIATASVIAVLAAACGGGAAAPTATRGTVATAAPTTTRAQATTAPAATATSAKPKPQGKAVVAVGDLGGQITDFHNFVNGNQLVISRHISDGLAFGDPNCECFAPNLAQSWKSSEDGLTWDIALRKGVKSHDGGDFTADDVVFSVNRIMDPAVGHVYRGRFALLLDKVVAVDPNLVRFQMKAPWAAFQYDLDRHMFIMPKKYFETVGLDQFKKKPSSYGPFRLTENAIGEKVEFEAFEDHFMRVPYVKNVTVRLLPQETTRVAALKAGEVDLIAGLSGPAQVDVQKQSNLRLVTTPQSSGLDLQFNIDYTTEASPFKDVRVRKAAALALDRQGYIKALYNGLGVVPRVGTIWDYAFGADKTLQPYPHDPEQAKKLLAEAGYPNGFNTTLNIPVGSESVAQAIAGDLSKIGIKAEVVPTEFSQYYARWREKKDLKPGMYTQTYPQYFDVSAEIDGFYRTDAAFTMVKDSVIDDLQVKQASEGNAAKREALLKQMVRRIYDGYYRIGIVQTDAVNAVGPRVKDWKPEPHEPVATNYEYIQLN